jgi:hypothetical protein
MQEEKNKRKSILLPRKVRALLVGITTIISRREKGTRETKIQKTELEVECKAKRNGIRTRRDKQKTTCSKKKGENSRNIQVGERKAASAGNGTHPLLKWMRGSRRNASPAARQTCSRHASKAS